MIIALWFCRRLLVAWLFAAAALVGLQLSFDCIQALQQSDSLGSKQAWQVWLFNIPSRINDYYPYIWLTAVLIAVGELSKSGALTVLRISGLRSAQLLALVVLPVLLSTLAWLWFYQSLGLPMHAQAEHINDGGKSDNLRSLWLREGDRFIYIGGSDGKQLHQVLIVDTDLQSSGLKQALSAAEASYNSASNDWLLHEVVRYQSQPDSSLRRDSVAELNWNLPLSADILLNLANEPQLVRLLDLWLLDDYLSQLDSGANEFSLELWQRLLLPLYVSTLAYLALGLVSSFARSSSLGTRVFMALGLAIGAESLNQLLGALLIQINLTAAYAPLSTLALNIMLGWYFSRRGLR